MNKTIRKVTGMTLLIAMILSLLSFSVSAAPASYYITTTPTGYKSAEDVVYKTFQQKDAFDGQTRTIVANWGARGEACMFLSTYAQNFYTESYDELLAYAGGTSTSSAPNSPLYLHLQELMASAQTHYTYYNAFDINVNGQNVPSNQNVRDYYRYTDCVGSDITQVNILYRGEMVTGDWNSGKIWNQEHCWPRSKLQHSDRLIKEQMVGDIAHLRPTNPSENGGRGNDCYGETKSSEFYDPGISSRGDVARMMLYMYVRWGAVDTMWGAGGVIENLDILVKWMQEDPVDTWEMGRNDAIQSITGTRNVFIDYPELAFALFGVEIPKTMVTPSGEASDGTAVPTPPVDNPSNPNNPDEPFVKPTTPAEILDALYKLEPSETLQDGPYTLTGKVIQINTPYSDSKKNIILTIEVDGHADKPVYCYRLTGDEAANVAVGDVLTIEGELYRYKDTFEFNSGCKILARVPAAEAAQKHILQQVGAKQPSCSGDGNISYFLCSHCGKCFADMGASQELTQEQIILKGGHKLSFVDRVEPTAEKEGTIAHYHCSVCKNNYADEAAASQLLSNQLRLPKLQGGQAGQDAGAQTLVIVVVVVAVLVAAGAVAGVVIVKKKKK